MKKSICLIFAAAFMPATAWAQIDVPAASAETMLSAPTAGPVGSLDPNTGEIIYADPNPGMMTMGTQITGAAATDAVTDASRVAVMYYRLSGQLAPFEAWAKATDSYKAASDFDRAQVLEARIAEMKDLYRLGNPADTITVETPARLGEYSFKNKGFIVTSFNSDVYFPFEFGGERFAVIAPDLVDNQWLAVAEDKKAMLLDTAAARHNRTLRALVQIEPNFADKFKKITLDNKEYAVISGKISSVKIYEPGKNDLLFEQNNRIVSQEQLDLEGLKLNNLKK